MKRPRKRRRSSNCSSSLPAGLHRSRKTIRSVASTLLSAFLYRRRDSFLGLRGVGAGQGRFHAFIPLLQRCVLLVDSALDSRGFFYYSFSRVATMHKFCRIIFRATLFATTASGLLVHLLLVLLTSTSSSSSPKTRSTLSGNKDFYHTSRNFGLQLGYHHLIFVSGVSKTSTARDM
ncbi:unnamed protein product [Amoebophrya sp. A120]|nr:unnamed protein product [Amoebophrya sp. A120]|eukprot:GSA120T00022241001.1